MGEYYGVVRSPEYLAHYGVKGMKWGVRKARERGNERALARHYRRAQKKLARLNRNADVNAQRAQQVKYAKRAGIGLGVSGLGVGGMLASKALSGKYMKNIQAAHDAFYGGMDNRVQRMIQAMNAGDHKTYGAIQRERAEAYKNYVDITDANFKKMGVSEKAKKVSAAIDLAGLGYGGYAGARSLAAYARTTPKGHARAVAKRDEFKREMDKAFKGYKPAKGYKPKKSLAQRFKNRKYFTNQDFKDAAKAGAMAALFGPYGGLSYSYYLNSKRAANEIPVNNNRHGKKRRR